ncbi:MAG: KAP family NTPase [Hyphomicrobiales bacterium]|nr:KAP family NTPase [Hyphomicrobiales bacterium]
MNGNFHGDRPISRPDDDLFGLASFADALATSLLGMNLKDGLAISVEGPWGSGKSSAIALALRTIKLRVLKELGKGADDLEKLSDQELDEAWYKCAKMRKTHIVRFNPWNFSGQENLVRAFFNELAAQIGADGSDRLKAAMDGLVSLLPFAFGFAAAHFGAGDIGKAVGERAKSALTSDSSLERAKRNLVGALKEADERIIVVIDDIDRLMPTEMRAVLSLVKSLGDLPNVLYVLVFDKDVVTKALAEGAEKIDPAFLEKIVQVSLQLPPPWRGELRKMLLARIRKITGRDPPDRPRWQMVLLKVLGTYLATPRDVIRLANTLQVIWPTVADDVDLADLVVVTTLQLFDPVAYALVRDNIEAITRRDVLDPFIRKIADAMRPGNARKPEAAEAAMALMFPSLANVWGHHPLDADHLSSMDQRRICKQGFYHNYFKFTRSSEMFSRTEVDALLTASDPAPMFKATLARLEDERVAGLPSRVGDLLFQIHATVHSRPLLTPEFAAALFDCSDDLIRREGAVHKCFCNDGKPQRASGDAVRWNKTPRRSNARQNLGNSRDS